MDNRFEVSTKINLVDYLTEQYTKAFYSGIAERLYLAQEFINSYNDILYESKGDVWSETFLINPETVFIEKLEADGEDDRCVRYSIDFSNIVRADLHDTFSNFAYVPKKLFKTKHIIGGVKDSTNKEVSHSYKIVDAVYTISRMLFTILFCCHPFFGRAYYKKILITDTDKKSFFEQDPKFIFDYEDNANRFVNGYHEAPWLLWNFLTDDQRGFWNEAFDGKIQSFAELFEKWHSNYDFLLSQSKTPCGEKLHTIVFSDEVVLTISDNIIGRKQMRCKYCLNSLLEKCEACILPGDKRVAQFLSVKVKATHKPVAADGIQSADVVEKDIVLYDGKEISGTDLPGGVNSKHLFTAMASKKLDILGLKCMENQTVVATCGDSTKKFEKDGIVPLFSGTQVTWGDYELIVPGTPPVRQPVAQQKPTTVPPAATQPAATQPVAPQPVAPQPAVPQPVATKPVAPQPAAPQPVAPQPAVPQPVATKPVAPQPAAAQSANLQTTKMQVTRIRAAVKSAEPIAFSVTKCLDQVLSQIESIAQQFEVEIGSKRSSDKTNSQK